MFLPGQALAWWELRHREGETSWRTYLRPTMSVSWAGLPH